MLIASAASSIPITRPITLAPVVPMSREIGPLASKHHESDCEHQGKNADGGQRAGHIGAVIFCQ